jgi:hypothetical protein
LESDCAGNSSWSWFKETGRTTRLQTFGMKRRTLQSRDVQVSEEWDKRNRTWNARIPQYATRISSGGTKGPWITKRTWPFLSAVCISSSDDCSTASASDNLMESCWFLLGGGLPFVAMMTAAVPHLDRGIATRSRCACIYVGRSKWKLRMQDIRGSDVLLRV